jgi:argininosuccinate synthase
MLVQFVHDHESQRTIGAMHGIGPTRARRLMRSAAYAWARNQGINLSCDKSVPFKADAKLVRNLYAGLRLFAQQQFTTLDAQSHKDKYDGTNAEF